MQNKKIKIRRANSQDKQAVITMLKKTKFFRPVELKTAEEVFDDAVAKGPKGDYQSFVAQKGSDAIGWICFGATPCTLGTYDIYWIAVSPQNQNCGVGSLLMEYATDCIKKHKGRMIVLDTSGHSKYLSTRRFYEKNGYHKAAKVKNFYADGDDQIIYTKHLKN